MKSNLFGIDASRWARLISISFVAQLGVQALAFAGGILVIRTLSPTQYALYTLANAALGTLTVLADSGVGAGVMAHAGRVWKDPRGLAVVVSTGLHLRRTFAAASLAVAVPLMFYLFHAHGAGWLTTLSFLAAVLPAFYTALSGSLLAIPLMLRQQAWTLQKTQLQSNVGRLVLLAGSLLVAPLGFIAIACNAASQLWLNRQLRRLQPDLLIRPGVADRAVRDELVGVVRRLLPGTVYYAFFGQITLWIISFLGSTTSVAQVGALSRLAMALTVFTSVLGTVVIPRFATMPASPRLLGVRYLQIQLLTVGISAIVVALVWAFPAQTLAILGRNYRQLNQEVLLATAGACVALLSGIIYSMNTARGRIPPAYFYPVTGIGATIVLALTLKLDTVSGIMLFNLLLNASSVVFGNFLFFFLREPPIGRHDQAAS